MLGYFGPISCNLCFGSGHLGVIKWWRFPCCRSFHRNVGLMFYLIVGHSMLLLQHCFPWTMHALKEYCKRTGFHLRSNESLDPGNGTRETVSIEWCDTWSAWWGDVNMEWFWNDVEKLFRIGGWIEIAIFEFGMVELLRYHIEYDSLIV